MIEEKKLIYYILCAPIWGYVFFFFSDQNIISKSKNKIFQIIYFKLQIIFMFVVNDIDLYLQMIHALLYCITRFRCILLYIAGGINKNNISMHMNIDIWKVKMIVWGH